MDKYLINCLAVFVVFWVPSWCSPATVECSWPLSWATTTTMRLCPGLSPPCRLCLWAASGLCPRPPVPGQAQEGGGGRALAALLPQHKVPAGEGAQRGTATGTAEAADR